MGPRCGHCGYNLTGAPGNRCPECGKLFVEAGVIVPRDRRGTWRLVIPLIALALLMGVIGVSYFAVRTAQAEAARAAAEAARAAAVRAFLQQTLGGAASQPLQMYVPAEPPTTLPAMLLPSERKPHPIDTLLDEN